jgi:putative transposase
MFLHDGYNRRHPRRLDPSQYQKPLQPVGIVFCTRPDRPVLIARDIPTRIAEAMRFNAANNGVELIAWSIMPDHLHAAARVSSGGGDILKFIHGFKKRTGRTIREAGIIGPIWQRSFWDRHLRPNERLARLVQYVAWNPVHEGLCDTWDQWEYTWLAQSPARYALASGEVVRKPGGTTGRSGD